VNEICTAFDGFEGWDSEQVDQLLASHFEHSAIVDHISFIPIPNVDF
jgi:hypothetical protein